MSKITEAIERLRQYRVMKEEELEAIEEKMILKAYEENRFEDLVNINPYLDFNTLDLNAMEFEWTEDYDVMSGYYKTETGEYLTTEEEFNELWEEEFEACKNEFSTYKTEKGFEIYHDSELVEIVENEDEVEDCIELSVEEILIDRLGGKDLYDLEYESDELYSCIVVKFGDYKIDEDMAKESGLIVVDVKDDLYLAVNGYGIDLSYQYMIYLIKTFKHLIPRFADRDSINWLRQRVEEELFIELMVECGLDEELLRKYLK